MLKRNSDFLRVYRKGKFFAGRILVIYVLSNNYNINRLGISTVKNFGSSVLRNRMRRLVKENYRIVEDKVDKSCDIVFLVRKTGEKEPLYKDVEKEMKFLLRKMGIFE